MKYVVNDSGDRTQYTSGAVRDRRDDKPRYDLIPPDAMFRVAMQYTRGAVKYGESNWHLGIPTQDMLASAMRHLEAWRLGAKEEDHLAAVVWNILAIIQYEEEGRLTPVYFRDKQEND